jgi:hypothetical protein
MKQSEIEHDRQVSQSSGCFFSILVFNQKLRNECRQKFFLNLTLFSHVRPSGVTYIWRSVLVHIVWLGSMVSNTQSCGLSHAAIVTPSDMTRLSHASSFGVTGPPRGRRFFFFLPLPLKPCGGSIGNFGFLSPNRSPSCHKSTPRVGIPIVLGTYVVFTISFYCILKISLEWTHVVTPCFSQKK